MNTNTITTMLATDSGQDLLLGDEFLFEIPEWIDAERFTDLDMEDLNAELKAIAEGGCESGAYMPAVTYHLALSTMNKHGDDVIGYLDDCGILSTPCDIQSWTSLAVHYLSRAVESWACGAFHRLGDEDRNVDGAGPNND
jgi:hypothetical protein